MSYHVTFNGTLTYAGSLQLLAGATKSWYQMVY